MSLITDRLSITVAGLIIDYLLSSDLPALVYIIKRIYRIFQGVVFSNSDFNVFLCFYQYFKQHIHAFMYLLIKVFSFSPYIIMAISWLS